ncbi:hypothetical protein, conserved [Trypanosoma cruzi]|uniref:Uncharacterized protein n=1 Tax=Trypanosoma cruzi (strain CL Brener) TaxID=353153 RepID=Q4DN98_TRYCC|nr:hypothetical protein, conserved [Trypanosoma cruzi]EAN94007.1 hypothetical protein, conserved [Trypanosoma cruzi]|eukprot:XP_815858.1 hypothetical protein [Trypanosoma cruzi strain CL Brener]
MLRVCNNVEEALELSKRWQVPLLIFVQSPPSEVGRHTDAFDFTEIYTTSSRGNRVIKPTFMLGNGLLASDGGAQRQVLEAVLHESRLDLVTIVHFMEAGSEAHNLFIAAVPEASNTVPRLHVFPSSLREQPRIVLHGVALTPGRICDAIRFGLQMPPPTKVARAKEEFMRQVEEMNAAVAEGGSTVLSTGVGITPTCASGTASGTVAGSGSGGLKGLHFIELNGLDKREFVLTSPGMTLRTVWVKVEQALGRERQVAGGTARSHGSQKFVLHIEPPETATPNSTSGEKATGHVVVDSVEAAAKIEIHTMPHNTRVTVVRNEPSATGPQPVRPSCGREPQTEHGERENVMRCDGGVCRIGGNSLSGEPNIEQQKDALPPTASAVEEKQETKPAHSSSITRENARIHVRCSLPSGGTHMVDDLDPAVATLSTHLRRPIAGLIGHDAFVFARVYPPHRFSLEEETKPLETLGMRSSSALRVVPTGGPPNAPQEPNLTEVNKIGLFGLVSSLLRRAGASTPFVGTTQTTASPFGDTRAAGTTAQGSRFRTMAEMRAKEEEEERRIAAESIALAGLTKEHRRKKANRYYGGGSTEYAGWDDNEVEKEDGKKDGESDVGEEATEHTKKNA